MFHNAPRCVVRRRIQVRWKVLTRAQRTVGQTSKSNKNWKLVDKNLLRKYLIIWWSGDFKRDEISPKWLDLDVWLIVECATAETFQRTSNKRSTATKR